MNLETLKNDKEYETALKRLSPNFDADPESPEGIEAEQLVKLIAVGNNSFLYRICTAYRLTN